MKKEKGWLGSSRDTIPSRHDLQGILTPPRYKGQPSTSSLDHSPLLLRIIEENRVLPQDADARSWNDFHIRSLPHTELLQECVEKQPAFIFFIELSMTRSGNDGILRSS